MEYGDDIQNGRKVRVMSEVWECPICHYTTNIVEDRKEHRETHRAWAWVRGIAR